LLGDLAELEAAAIRTWQAGTRAFIQEGAGTGQGIAANRAAHRNWALRSRVLVDVSSVDLTTAVLGTPIKLPVMVAPSGLHTLVHPDGEVATAAGAKRADTIMILSSGTGRSLEDVAEIGGDRWFQLYWGADRDRVKSLVGKVTAAGYKALCLTADMPVRPLVGTSMRAGIASTADARPYYVMPRSAHLTTGAWDHDARLTWKDFAWLRSITSLPIVVKGIMSPEDAVAAAQAGADGVIVSNHGGRALDNPWGTLDALPEVIAALSDAGATMEVYVDGGFRHGSEVLVALALGARAVLIGRPVLWALTLFGAEGVTGVLETLGSQLATTMAMVGAVCVTDLDSSRIRRIQVPGALPSQ
jgi:4-hydroxymandelate oxidase